MLTKTSMTPSAAIIPAAKRTGWPADGWPLLEAVVRAVLVSVGEVDEEDALEVEEVVELDEEEVDDVEEVEKAIVVTDDDVVE